MRLSVIGTGYLGATHAACLSRWGHEVIGYDVDPERVAALAEGRCPFREPGLDDVVGEGLGAGRLRFTTDPAELDGAEVHFLCVGTPQGPGGFDADLAAVWGAAETLLDAVGEAGLVVGRSTVPVGTAGALQQRLGQGWDVAWNPEFLREGHAVDDSLLPERIVVGAHSERAHQQIEEVYRPAVAAGVPVIRTDLATAELAKVSANVMLASRIAVLNVLAEVCEAAEGNVHDLVRVLASDSRIGGGYLTPGIGFGGSCLPKDVRAFVTRAHELGAGDAVSVLQEVDADNMRQRARAVDRALALLRQTRAEGDRNATIAVLGAAFKAGTDDVRDSPALDVAGTLHALGHRVRVYDPCATESARRVRPELAYAADAIAACQDADLVMLLTEWPELVGLDPVALSGVVRTPVVLDGRLALDAEKWRRAGWRLYALGLGEVTEP